MLDAWLSKDAVNLFFGRGQRISHGNVPKDHVGNSAHYLILDL